MLPLGSDMIVSETSRALTTDTLLRLTTQKTLCDDNSIDQYVIEKNFRRLWCLLSEMIRARLLKHEPCLLPELGAFVLIECSPSNSSNSSLRKEPFFVLDTTFARRHRLSRIKNPNLSSAVSLSLQGNGNSTYIHPDTTLSSFNMQTLDYATLQHESGLTRDQLMTAISQIFFVIDENIHPHKYCDLEFPNLGNFRVSFGLATFDFNDSFLEKFTQTLNNISNPIDY